MASQDQLVAETPSQEERPSTSEGQGEGPKPKDGTGGPTSGAYTVFGNEDGTRTVSYADETSKKRRALEAGEAGAVAGPSERIAHEDDQGVWSGWAKANSLTTEAALANGGYRQREALLGANEALVKEGYAKEAQTRLVSFVNDDGCTAGVGRGALEEQGALWMNKWGEGVRRLVRQMRGRGGGAGGHGATAEERSTAEQVAAQVRKQGRSSPGVVSASESWTDEALRFLSRQKHPKRVKLAALNYANCSYIGGNYSDGGFVRAQEEELCRLCPALFHSMQSCPEAGCKSGYLRTEYRKHVFGARFNDGYSKARNVLFTGEVRCMRGPAEHSYRLLHQEANRVQAGFVEAAAPLFNRGHDQAFQKWRDDPAEWYEKVMLNVFWAPKSVDENYDVMVVGPWGCGAFGNSPDVVARSIFEVIEKHKLRYLYKEIHFCLGRRMQQDFTAGGACNANIQAFQKEFERRAESGQCVVEDYTEELQRRAGEWMQEER